MKEIRAIGLMSGTSLDGVDIAFCHFTKEDKWQFEILHADTIRYPENWKKQLENAHNLNAFDFVQLHNNYGVYLGNVVKNFINKYSIDDIQLIGSHGHTVFHQPRKNLTCQIGNGAAIAGITGINTVCDFRTTDMVFGGQGAPLVPIGDKLLFPNYDYCINLGGFGNISFDQDEKRVAFDICPVNMALNYLAKEYHLEFDRDGNMAARGKINETILQKLNSLKYYALKPPKSLGREWFHEMFLPILEAFDIPTEDKLVSVIKHIVIQIKNSIPKDDGKVLLSGGGTLNKFLVNTIKKQLPNPVVIPAEIIIHYKEALVFAFLAVLRENNMINCLASVTGASKNTCCGAYYRA